MKHTFGHTIRFYLPAVGLGLLSLERCGVMLRDFVDGKGLLIAGNPLGRLLWIIGAGFAVYLLLQVRTIGGSGTYEDNFPKSIFWGLLVLLSGIVMMGAVRSMAFDAAWQKWLGYAAAASILVSGSCRMVGKRPSAPLSGILCLFYISMLVSNYRHWSANPQLHDYAYQLLAGVLLMMAAFHRTCCDAEILQRKPLLLTGLGALFCCLAALGSAEMVRFYLASALWAAGSVCRPIPLPPDPEPEEETEQPPQTDGQ